MTANRIPGSDPCVSVRVSVYLWTLTGFLHGGYHPRSSSMQDVVFLSSSMVEHSAVNRRVVGSSPTSGAFDHTKGTEQQLRALRRWREGRSS